MVEEHGNYLANIPLTSVTPPTVQLGCVVQVLVVLIVLVVLKVPMVLGWY